MTTTELAKMLLELGDKPLAKSVKLTIGPYHIVDGYNWGFCHGHETQSKQLGCCEAMRQRKLSDEPVIGVYIK